MELTGTPEGASGGHIECERIDGTSYGFTVYLYETFEDYLCYLVMNGIYGFSNPIPKEWKSSRLYRLLGEQSVRRIVSAIDAGRSYA